MSSRNSVYHFLIRKGGSEEEHRVLSVVRSMSEHRAFSSSRVTVLWVMASCRALWKRLPYSFRNA